MTVVLVWRLRSSYEIRYMMRNISCQLGQAGQWRMRLSAQRGASDISVTLWTRCFTIVLAMFNHIYVLFFSLPFLLLCASSTTSGKKFLPIHASNFTGLRLSIVTFLTVRSSKHFNLFPAVFGIVEQLLTKVTLMGSVQVVIQRGRS